MDRDAVKLEEVDDKDEVIDRLVELVVDEALVVLPVDTTLFVTDAEMLDERGTASLGS